MNWDIACSGTIATACSLEEMFAAAREFGFDYADLLMITGWAHVDMAKLASDFAGTVAPVGKLLGKYNLALKAINMKYSVPVEAADPASVSQRGREFEALMRFMREFGIGHVDVLPTLRDDPEYHNATRDAFLTEMLRQQAAANDKGIAISFEPHTQSAVCSGDELHAAVEKYPDINLTYDPSHIITMGGDMRDWDDCMGNVTMVHLRDARKDEMCVPYGTGSLDLPHALGKLAECGYTGPISVEYLCDKRDERMYADMRAFTEEINRLAALIN